MQVDGFVIVGAGEAGVAAAFEMRRSGFVGRITLLDGEAEAPYARPPLSKDVLAGQMPNPPAIVDTEAFLDARIDVRSGVRVAEIDPHRRLVVVREAAHPGVIRFERLLLATGSRARRLAGVEGHVLRNLNDSKRLAAALQEARSLVIIGAGVIGLEVASVATSLGVKTTVLEAAPQIMGRCLSAHLSRTIAELHQANGVEIRLGIRNLKARTDGETMSVETDQGLFQGSLALVAAGGEPNTGLAEAAGCEIEDGILVDQYGETSIPGIYAAGDVASILLPRYGTRVRLEAWQHARRHGASVARNMCGGREVYDEVPWFWTDQHGTNLQVAGLTRFADTEVVRHVSGGRVHFLFGGGALVAAATLNRPADMGPAIRLIEHGWAGPPELLANPRSNLRDIARAAPPVGVAA